MTDLTIGGETFHVLMEGDETLPVVVLSHALGGDLHLWDGQVADLRKHFRVIRYDTRGHGSSVKDGAGPYSIETLGRDALAILDALDLPAVHWIGLSMGGAIGQWLLINAPSRIERAVLANTTARFGQPDVWNARILAAQHDGMETLCEATLSRWFTPAMSLDDEQVAPIRRTLLATLPEAYAACCAALRDLDLREDLRRVDHPVLVIAGDEDPAISPEQTGFLAETIPNAQRVTLKAAHLSNIEATEAFNKAVVDFLTAKPARRSAPKARPPLPAPRRPAGRRSPATRGPTPDARRPPPLERTRTKMAETETAETEIEKKKPGRAVPSARGAAPKTTRGGKDAAAGATKTTGRPSSAAKGAVTKAKTLDAKAAKPSTAESVKAAAKAKPSAAPKAEPPAAAKTARGRRTPEPVVARARPAAKIAAPAEKTKRAAKTAASPPVKTAAPRQTPAKSKTAARPIVKAAAPTKAKAKTPAKVQTPAKAAAPAKTKATTAPVPKAKKAAVAAASRKSAAKVSARSGARRT